VVDDDAGVGTGQRGDASRDGQRVSRVEPRGIYSHSPQVPVEGAGAHKDVGLGAGGDRRADAVVQVVAACHQSPMIIQSTAATKAEQATLVHWPGSIASCFWRPASVLSRNGRWRPPVQCELDAPPELMGSPLHNGQSCLPFGSCHRPTISTMSAAETAFPWLTGPAEYRDLRKLRRVRPLTCGFAPRLIAVGSASHSMQVDRTCAAPNDRKLADGGNQPSSSTAAPEATASMSHRPSAGGLSMIRRQGPEPDIGRALSRRCWSVGLPRKSRWSAVSSSHVRAKRFLAISSSCAGSSSGVLAMSCNSAKRRL